MPVVVSSLKHLFPSSSSPQSLVRVETPLPWLTPYNSRTWRNISVHPHSLWPTRVHALFTSQPPAYSECACISPNIHSPLLVHGPMFFSNTYTLTTYTLMHMARVDTVLLYTLPRALTHPCDACTRTYIRSASFCCALNANSNFDSLTSHKMAGQTKCILYRISHYKRPIPNVAWVLLRSRIMVCWRAVKSIILARPVTFGVWRLLKGFWLFCGSHSELRYVV